MLVSQVHEQRHQATAHLAQTMSFLALSTAELEATLVKELNQNPALELVDELRCPGCGRPLRRLPCSNCAAPHGDGAPVVYLSPRSQPSDGRQAADDISPEAYEVGERERLDDYLLRQIGPALTAAQRPIAAYILARLDDDGLLLECPREIALYLRTPLSEVELVLSLIQHADPPGVGATTPVESLLIQLDCLAETESTPEIALARAIIASHFEALGRKLYGHIARQLGVTRAMVEAAEHFIRRNLTPYPARAAWGEGKQPPGADSNVLVNPDTTITQPADEPNSSLMVEVFAPFSGWLRVNPEFKAALTDCDEADREKWAPAVERAMLIAKCVQQRNHTMRRLMEIIATEQRGFILGGDGDLHPLTRAEVARRLGVHESTISRAVMGKCAALPDGRLVPLSKFFDRSLSVRDRVRHLIHAETRPLTDDQIAAELRRQGILVARRTVAKYRNMLGILPANLRGREARCSAKGRARLPGSVYQRALAAPPAPRRPAHPH